MTKLKTLVIALLAALPVAAAQIGTLTADGLELKATGGVVMAYFAGSDAGYDSELNFVEPVGYAFNPLFNNHITPIGTSVNLGSFAAGTTLRFQLNVLNTGNAFVTGPATGNLDGIVHAATTGWAADGVIAVNGTLVGFEDLYNGGDLDYNDNLFVFTNVASPTPEPGTYMMMGGGLGLLGLLRFRKRS